MISNFRMPPRELITKYKEETSYLSKLESGMKESRAVYHDYMNDHSRFTKNKLVEVNSRLEKIEKLLKTIKAENNNEE